MGINNINEYRSHEDMIPDYNKIKFIRTLGDILEIESISIGPKLLLNIKLKSGSVELVYMDAFIKMLIGNNIKIDFHNSGLLIIGETNTVLNSNKIKGKVQKILGS